MRVLIAFSAFLFASFPAFADINIAGQLRDAIDAGRFRLDAQLILPFAGAESARPHYELLIRMIDDEGHTIGPDRFMSAAQRYQLMPAIDRWVLSKTIEMLKPHAELLAGRSIAFAINFSGQSLSDEAFPDFLDALILCGIGKLGASCQSEGGRVAHRALTVFTRLTERPRQGPPLEAQPNSPLDCV